MYVYLVKIQIVLIIELIKIDDQVLLEMTAFNDDFGSKLFYILYSKL